MGDQKPISATGDRMMGSEAVPEAEKESTTILGIQEHGAHSSKRRRINVEIIRTLDVEASSYEKVLIAVVCMTRSTEAS